MMKTYGKGKGPEKGRDLKKFRDNYDESMPSAYKPKWLRELDEERNNQAQPPPKSD